MKLKKLVPAALMFTVALIASCSGDDDDPQGVQPPRVDNFRFAIDPSGVTPDTNQDYLNFVDTQFGGAVAPLNRVDNFFNGYTVPVSYQLCNNVANAFYDPNTRSVILCDELLVLGANVFIEFLELTLEDAIFSSAAALTYTLYHEIGHSLDDIRGFSSAGNFESIADAIGVVLSVQTQQPEASILGATFLLAASGDSSFVGVHGSGEDRAGDIFCWTIGSSSRIAAAFPELTQLFNDGGRDCVGEYATQYAAVSNLVPNLQNIPPRASVRNREADTISTIGSAYDRQLTEIMRNQ